jgi:hypothetical protein
MKRLRPQHSRTTRDRKRDEDADPLRLTHLRREVKTALELGVAALAPTGLVDALATAGGLLDALAEFPRGSPPVLATLPRAMELAETALKSWQDWQAHPARRRSA